MTYARAKAKYEAKSGPADDDGLPANHRCAAEGCPMAGALSAGSRTSNWCAYHDRCHLFDQARITSVLNQHKDLRDIINDGRTLLASTEADPDTFADEWKRMRSLLLFAGYEDPPLAPGALDTLPGWLYRCETMLHGYVTKAIKARRAAADGRKTPQQHLHEVGP